MVIWRTFFLCILTLSPLAAWGQPNWKEIVMPAFGMLINEINDSIAGRRMESDALRREMNKIISEKNFDRVLIVGQDDKYVNEGMHKHFKREPIPLQVNMERDSKMQHLENLHVQLYHSDRILFRWIDLLAQLRAHPDMALNSRWARDWMELPEKQRPKSDAKCIKWVQDALVCDLVRNGEMNQVEKNTQKVKDFSPEFKGNPWDTVAALNRNWTLPVPAEGIAASFPMSGQFAFQRSESIPGIGYIIFSKNTTRSISSKVVMYDKTLKARWTSALGGVEYTNATLNYMQGVYFFNLPDFFIPETVYRLELLALSSSHDPMPSSSSQTCWDAFRGKTSAGKQAALEASIGETKITELYFRAGKYDVHTKAKTMQGVVDWERGTVTFETDEPLDATELYGNKYISPIATFSLQSAHFYKVWNALNSKVVSYYLTVPRVEYLDTVPIKRLTIAELDHTMDAEFVRKAQMGNFDAYPKLPIEWQGTTPLYGGYLACKLQEVKLQDSLVASKIVPFITKEYFKRGETYAFPPTKCVLHIGELKQLMFVAKLQQEQLQRRMEERAHFFYMLEKRRSERQGKVFTATLQEFQQKEQENLPPEIKLILDTQFPDVFKKKFTLFYRRDYPGSSQYSTLLEIKLDPTQ